MPSVNTLVRFDPSKILQPAQGYSAALDAAAFGPNLTIYSGQALGQVTATGLLAPYSTGSVANVSNAAPTGQNAAGGSLAVGTYFAVVTALFGTSEQKKSNESAGIVTGTGFQTINFSWTAVAGATGYNLYRTAAGGATGSETFLVSIPGGQTTFSDTGVLIPTSTTPPSTNPAAPTNGTQVFSCISQYPFVTDATGMCYTKYSLTPGTPAAAAADYWATPQSTMPVFIRGVFNPTQLVGFDSVALAGFRTLFDGNISF
jgi:hypothetical protein